jgi:hypothetical protein
MNNIYPQITQVFFFLIAQAAVLGGGHPVYVGGDATESITSNHDNH